MRVTDAHIHIQPFHMLKAEVRHTFWQKKTNREELEGFAADAGKLLRHLDADGIERVGLINYISPDVMGFTSEVNGWMMRYASSDPSRLLAFGSVHPAFTTDAGGDTDRVIEMGARALKIHPPHQLFRANAYLDALPGLADIYRRAEAAGIPVTIHTGTSVFPGARSRFGDPMDVDDVAIDFPKLKILLAHGGRPLWMDAAFFVVRRHPNVFLEVSGIPPTKLLEYFPRLEEIAHKTIWGTDWPSPGIKSMRQNVEQFLQLPMSDGSRASILHDNAARIWQG
jgi:predicted TIM-barrel fold metal-dependent hydrolase